MAPDQIICAVCPARGDKLCSDCRKVAYCSIAHQNEHWNVHKSACIHYKFEFKENLGVVMTAKRNIPSDHVILTETAILLFPMLQFGEGCVKENEFIGHPCYGCLKLLPPLIKRACRCSKCGLTMCSRECEKCPVHANRECQILKELNVQLYKQKVPSGNEMLHQYLDICTLGMIQVRQKQPEVWRRLETLEKSPRYAFCITNKNLFSPTTGGSNGSNLKLSLKYAQNNSKVVLQAYQLLMAFWQQMKFRDKIVRGLFCDLNSMPHSCLSNAVVSIQPTAEGMSLQCSIRSVKSICKGEVLNINFSDLILSSTEQRKVVLYEKNIHCSCDLCVDPTEMRTLTSAIRCSQIKECEGGLYLDSEPTKFLPSKAIVSDEENEIRRQSVWECFKCGHSVPRFVIERILNNIQRCWDTAAQDPNMDPLKQALCFIGFYTQCLLHEEHYMILFAKDYYLKAARLRMLWEQGFPVENEFDHELIEVNPLPKEWTQRTQLDLRTKRDFSLDLYKYFAKVKPIRIIERGYILWEFNLYCLLVRAYQFASKIIKEDNLMDILINCYKGIKEANEIFKMYQETSRDIVFGRMIDKFCTRLSFVDNSERTCSEKITNLLRHFEIPDYEPSVDVSGSGGTQQIAQSTSSSCRIDTDILPKDDSEESNYIPASELQKINTDEAPRVDVSCSLGIHQTLQPANSSCRINTHVQPMNDCDAAVASNYIPASDLQNMNIAVSQDSIDIDESGDRLDTEKADRGRLELLEGIYSTDELPDLSVDDYFQRLTIEPNSKT